MNTRILAKPPTYVITMTTKRNQMNVSIVGCQESFYKFLGKKLSRVTLEFNARASKSINV